jgi:hypothetical protein
MYGFHKVNKVQRGTRFESQEYEFSHEYFVRGRADLLDTIKRKQLDTSLPPNPMGPPMTETYIFDASNPIEVKAHVNAIHARLHDMGKELMEQRQQYALLQRSVTSIMSWFQSQGTY